MFSSMSGEGHLSRGQSSSSPAERGVASPGMDGQESSWIGLLSRPALSFLQRYLPGRPRAAARADPGAGWGLKNSFVDEEREFLRQLDDMMPLQQVPAPHLTYMRCEHDGAAGLLEPSGGSSLPWLTAESLREMGIHSAEEMELNLCQQTQFGYLSSVRTFFSHVLLSSVSSQEMKPAGGQDWDPAGPSVQSSGGKSRPWWGGFWGGEESSQRGLLSLLSWAEEGSVTGQLCPQQPGTKDPQTTAAFVPGGARRWTLGENTGPTDHKEQPANNGGLQTVQNTEGSRPDPQLSTSDHLSSSGAAAHSEAAQLTPDQDNGYSSLEEEHFQVKALSDQPPQEAEPAEPGAAERPQMEEQKSEEEESPSEEEEQEVAPQEGQSAEALATPQCQNRAIAFIMGCPCSDDSQSESSEDEDEDDDDGFDSEGLSDLTESSEDEDDDDEVSGGEADSEAERLWNSLCQTGDPYNPRNFTARLHTATSPPRSIPTSTPPSSTHSSPASSPDLTPLPLSSFPASPPLAASSPPSGSDTWDDSTSASEVDEAESLRLWSSFSCSSDPYSPYNFQAPLRTQVHAEAAPRTRTRTRKASRSPRHDLASPPEYRKEEAEERLDSGFSEPSTSSSTVRSCSKKVRFCDDVEEFFASCGEEEEDRRGPWEELARDRCRFLRRCQEVEQSIAYALQPQHRRRVARRLASMQRLLDA